MFKIITKIFLALLIVTLIGAFITYGYLPGIIAGRIQKIAAVPTSLKSVGISLDELDFKKLKMANVPNSILPTALEIDEISVKMPIKRVFDDKIVIDRMECENFFIGLEFASKSNRKGNWTTIINNIDANTPDTNKKNKSIFISRLGIKNVKIALVYRDNPKNIQKLDIKYLELKNISTEGDFPIDQLTKVILKLTLQQIFSLKGLGNMLKELLNPELPSSLLKPPFFSHLDSVEIDTQN